VTVATLRRTADVDEALIAEVQRRLLVEHADVVADPDPLRRRIRLRGAIGTLLSDRDLDGASFARVLLAVSDRIVGLGLLEPLLRDRSVTEIMVNGPDAIYVERDGALERISASFPDDAAVRRVIDRIVAPLGLRIDGSQPWVDARLPDGARVHAILPPLAIAGPTLTIRRFARTHPSLSDLVANGSLSDARAELLRTAVGERRNLLVIGGTGSGKTTLLRALCGEIEPHARVITIEDTAELALQRPHVVALEARPANGEGRGLVTIRDLVRQALRMRPDRLVVGEVRGVEVLDMLAAMNTGHDGSMSTAHANSADEVLARIESMAAPGGLRVDALHRQIAAAIDLVVEVARHGNRRRIDSIWRLTAGSDGVDLVPLEDR
jgi:pilus assembly protein CpaF